MTIVDDYFQRCSFVIASDSPRELPAQPWWRGYSTKSVGKHLWAARFLDPLAPIDLVSLNLLERHIPRGTRNAMPWIRSLIKEAKKKQVSEEVGLRILWGCAVLHELANNMPFLYFQSQEIAEYCDESDIGTLFFDYRTVGYESLRQLTKANIRSLIEVFGEPEAHISPQLRWPMVSERAISRYCWHASSQQYFGVVNSIESRKAVVEQWLRRTIGSYVDMQMETVERAQISWVRREWAQQEDKKLSDNWVATHRDFIVADLETTGLDPLTDQILEVAAILCNPAGEVLREFSTLIRIRGQIPPNISDLTGIYESDIDSCGLSLHIALTQFLDFVGNLPLFFHNAPFDEAFLNKAVKLSGLQLTNRIFDTLPMAAVAFPTMNSLKLATLAKILQLEQPTHRALADAKTTLAVLLESRSRARHGPPASY